MAFQSVVFPNLKLIHGFKKGIIYPTSIVSNGNAEFRINRMALDKFTWSYPGRAITATSKVALYQFYKGVNGSLDSFLFCDPDFPAWSGQQLVSAGGAKWKFNFPGSVNHPLYNYDGAMVVKRNGVTESWSHSIENGFSYLTVSNTSPTDTVTIESGACYLSARFDGAIGWSIEALNTDNTPLAVNLDAVSLIEVFEHA